MEYQLTTQLEFIDVAHCPLCQSKREDHSIFDTHSDQDLDLVYKSCRICGLVFQSPRPSERSLRDFYLADYRIRISGSEEPTSKNHWVQQRRAENTLSFIENEIKVADHVLDIGSSLGLLLKAFSARYQCKCIGVEPGEVHRGESIQSGIDTYTDLDQLPESVVGSFDVISMMHVLEHIPAPVEYLTELAEKWLNRRGYLLLEVPNFYAHPSFELAHQITLSASRLNEIARKAGYRLRKLQVHGQPYSRLLPLFILALFQKSEDPQSSSGPISRERGVRIKRWLGYGRTRAARWIAPYLLGQRELQPWDGHD